MSLQQSDNLSYAVFGTIIGVMQYFNGPALNIHLHLLSIEWVIASSHAVITAAFCGGAGWVGKKIGEWAYNYIVQYFKEKFNKK